MTVDWTGPVSCAVCGTDLKVARVGWRAIDTAAGLLFVCESHPAEDVREAVLNALRSAGDPIRADLDAQIAEMDALFDFEAGLNDVYRRAGMEPPSHGDGT